MMQLSRAALLLVLAVPALAAATACSSPGGGAHDVGDAATNDPPDAKTNPTPDAATNGDAKADGRAEDAAAPDASGNGDAEADAEATDAGSDALSADAGWGAHADVGALFDQNCGTCHGGAWDSCANDQSNATTLADAISNGFMPRGRTLSPQDKATMLDWLQNGAPCGP